MLKPLKVKVEEEIFIINCGQGYNDWCWLALCATKLYGKKQYPSGNYLPSSLKIMSDYLYQVHPRSKIYQNYSTITQKEGEIQVIVDLLKPEADKRLSQLDQAERIQWFNQAFGKDRDRMKVTIEYQEAVEQVKKGPHINYYAKINFTIFREYRHCFKNETSQQISLPLEIDRSNTQVHFTVFSSELDLPFGTIDPKISIYWKNQDPEEDQSKIKENYIEETKSKVEFYCQPSPVEHSEKIKKIKEGMKIPEQLTQQLQQQEQEVKKDNLTGSFCPYSFNQLWQIIISYNDEIMINKFEDNIMEQISNIIDTNLSRLYEIFFSYSMIHNQITQKTEELAITYQEVMHFLKFYEVITDQQKLIVFLDSIEHFVQHNSDDCRSTIYLETGVKFPQFIMIIIKTTFFIQGDSQMKEELTNDKVLENVVNKILEVESNEEQLNEFQKHMKYNITLMSFLKENEQALVNVFADRLTDQYSGIDKKYFLYVEDIKQIVTDTGFKGDNLDDILSTCWTELLQEHRYEGYTGVFYYEFLQVLQWLSMVLIADNDEEDEEKDDENEVQEEGVEILIEKLKFFLESIPVNK